MFGFYCVRYSFIMFGVIFDVKIRFDSVFDIEEEFGNVVDSVKKVFGNVVFDKVLEEVWYFFVLVEDVWLNVMKVLVVIIDKRLDSSEEEV